MKLTTSIAIPLALALLVFAGTALAAAITVTVDDGGGDDVGYYTALQIDAAGYAVISYFDQTNDLVKVAHCNDAVCSAPSIETIANVGSQGGYISLMLNATGMPVISYYDSLAGDLYVATCLDPNCAATTIELVDGAAANVGLHTSLQLDANGFPVISYYDATNGNLKLAHCSNTTCTAASIVTVDASANDDGFYTSLRLDANGFPVISYHDVIAGAVKLAHCLDPNCTAAQINTVDTTNFTGFFGTSLALDAQGFPVISYYALLTGQLMIAHCIDVDCNLAPVITVVDNTTNVGLYSSLQLSGGNPVISYFDADNENLKLAECQDPNCTAVDLRVLDSAGEVGWDTSLQLGSLLVSYYDATNGDLKLATLSDPIAAIPTPVVVAVRPEALPETGFAPGGFNLEAQSDGSAYTATGLQLSIAELDLVLDIVGVPQVGSSWDVSWLGNSVGYLQGTAFPTLPGNSVLTAHVWGADNKPGPFADLKQLAYGDHIQIFAWGQTYTYEVRSNELLSPRALSPLQLEEYDWITLITCEGFNLATGDYLFRRAVRAVLVSVD